MEESHFERITRQGLEGNMSRDYGEGDMHQVNAGLEKWPYGRDRPPVSLEYAHEIARNAIRRRDQPTEEIPVITPEMLEDAV